MEWAIAVRRILATVASVYAHTLFVYRQRARSTTDSCRSVISDTSRRWTRPTAVNQSTDDRHLWISLSVHLCVQRDGPLDGLDAPRSAGSSTLVDESCSRVIMSERFPPSLPAGCRFHLREAVRSDAKTTITAMRGVNKDGGQITATEEPEMHLAMCHQRWHELTNVAL